MSQRIWRKNAINFQHCNEYGILNLKVGEICRNAYGEKMQ